ncbi:MAG: hypothetical protein PWQ91_318 [Eubacteriales bacterium]|nr:hypothetical protein [Eubacteriales bacterium]MDN5363257.1 hypothetical protein [Eubacteriales bacterium]
MWQLPGEELDRVVKNALGEDVGRGDWTTLATVPAEREAEAVIFFKEEGVVAGLPVAARVFTLVDPAVSFLPMVKEGEEVAAGQEVAHIKGPARALLTGERTALNFLQHLSGIATRTRRLAVLIADTGARLVDTRKTVPGMRLLAKYAVAVGGGGNHRLGLDDGILIKDNHIKAAGGIAAAVKRARVLAPHTLRIEVECETMAQVREALQAGADIIMLDNMSPEQVREAARLVAGRALIEVSGGITEENIRAMALAGADLISVGALTHSVRAVDISMEIVAVREESEG